MITPAARRLDAGLLTMAGFLTTAYLLAPALLGPSRAEDFPRAFVHYWNEGSSSFPSDLQPIVDHQFRSHLIRTAIALLLLAALLTLLVRLPRYRVLLGVVCLVAAVLLIANVQGFVSPFGTLLPHLASHPAEPGLPAALTQVRDQITNGPRSPVLDVMLDQYRRWHVVKAVLIGILSASLAGLAVMSWPRRRVISLLTAALGVAALVVVAADVTTVADPDAPFLLLLQGD